MQLQLLGCLRLGLAGLEGKKRSKREETGNLTGAVAEANRIKGEGIAPSVKTFFRLTVRAENGGGSRAALLFLPFMERQHLFSALLLLALR